MKKATLLLISSLFISQVNANALDDFMNTNINRATEFKDFYTTAHENVKTGTATQKETLFINTLYSVANTLTSDKVSDDVQVTLNSLKDIWMKEQESTGFWSGVKNVTKKGFNTLTTLTMGAFHITYDVGADLFINVGPQVATLAIETLLAL